ncbi:zinc-dependent alcohol dehydrogenase family protein [soil metagenome]
MKAAICYTYGDPLVVEDIELAPPKAGEVRVQLAAAAICHSDVHLIRGDWRQDFPVMSGEQTVGVVAGHEASGIVEEIGPGVTLVEPGDHVVVTLMRSCGRCFFCATGQTHLCEGDYALNDETRMRTKDGRPLFQGLRTSAFADQTVVDQSQLVPIPKEIPLESAALIACGVITGLGAVVNTAKVPPGSSVVVIGCGGVGLNSVQGAKLSGAHPIIAIDLLDNKLDAARKFGATHTINASNESDPAGAVRELTHGRGADYAFVTVGDARPVTDAIEMVRRGGEVTMVGIPEAEATVPLSIPGSVGKEIRLMGSVMGSTRLSVDVPRLVDLYQGDRLLLDELITNRYPLEEINEAIESMERGEALRNVIVFQ